MAECIAVEPGVREANNMVKNRKLGVHNVYQEASATEIANRIETDNQKLGIQEHPVGTDKEGNKIFKPLYTIMETGKIAVNKRVSDLVQKMYERGKSEEELKKIRESKDNLIKREGGTFLHKLAQEIIDNIIGKTKNKEDIRDKLEEDAGNFGIPKDQFGRFYNGISQVYKQIEDQQIEINRLNKKRGLPPGKVRVLTEQTIVDVVDDMGGTVDLIAIFSDGTASIYDWKSITPYSSYTTGYGKNAKIIHDFIPFGKEEQYRLQIQRYKSILVDRYGVKAIRQSRVVPIHVQYELKKEQDRKEGNNYTGKLVLVEVGDKASEHLKQLPLGFEKTGYSELDTFIQGQLSLIEKLKDKQSKLRGDRAKWDYFKNRIDRIKKATNDIILKQQFAELYESIRVLMKNFEKNGHQMSTDELRDLDEEFKAYSGIVQNTTTWLDDMSNKNAKQRIQKIVDANSGPINRTLARIQQRLGEETLADIAEEDKDETGELKAIAEEGWMKRTFGRLSEFNHPIFRKFKELKDTAVYKKREALKGLGQDIEKSQNALFNWGKAKGYSKQETFNLLINSNTGNLYSHLSPEFWKDRNEAKKNKDSSWLKARYHYDDFTKWKKEYEERLKQQKAYLKAQNNNLETLTDGEGNVQKTIKQLSQNYTRSLKAWKTKWDLENSNAAWLNESNYYHLRINEEVAEENYSKEYRYIKANKPLLDFYELFEKYNNEFRNMLGANWKDLPPNFVANIRRDMMERATDKGFDISGAGREFLNSLNVREEDDEIFGHRDILTGELQRRIPKLFLNKFITVDGETGKYTQDLSQKSYDLGRILYLFGEMAYNYKYMEEIEAQTLGLKTALEKMSHLDKGTRGNFLKNILGEKAKLKQGKESKTFQLFEAFTDYYLYGVKHRDRGVTFNFLGRELNSTKAILAAKHFYGMKVLGFAVIPGTAAWIAGRTAGYLEAKKAITYTPEQMKKTMLLWATNKGKYLAMADFFDIHVEETHYREALKLSAKRNVKYLNERALFSPLRAADENIDNHILISMAQNYGFDKEGNLRRLKNLPEGAKSIFDGFKLDEKTGKISVEGLTQDNYIAFRNAARTVSVGIKGALSEEDTNYANLNIYWNLAMQFKTWIPGLIRERLGGLEFDESIDAARYGRYRAFFAEFQKDQKGMEGAAVMDWIGGIVIPKFIKLSFDLITFGKSPYLVNRRINKERARLHFDRWRINNPEKARNIKFEDFMEIKTSQIRAALVEARVILGLLALLAFLGAEGDDDEPRYMKTWLGRTLYKTLNRAHSEITFAFTPGELIRITQNPIPMASLFQDIIKTLKNTIDEGYHFATGTPDPHDRTPFFYYSSQWIIGMSQLRRLIELFEQDKRSPY